MKKWREKVTESIPEWNRITIVPCQLFPTGTPKLSIWYSKFHVWIIHKTPQDTSKCDRYMSSTYRITDLRCTWGKI